MLLVSQTQYAFAFKLMEYSSDKRTHYKIKLKWLIKYMYFEIRPN